MTVGLLQPEIQSVCTSEQLCSNEEISSSNEKRLHTEWRPHGFSFQMARGHKLVLPALLLYNAQMIFSKLSEGLINPQARDRNVLLPHQKSQQDKEAFQIKHMQMKIKTLVNDN